MSRAKPSIVVADDHAAMLSRVSNVLQSHYDIVAAVENGALAVRAVTEFQPDLVVLDIAMPELNGIDAARQIQKLGLATKIVFLTVQTDPEYVDIARALGASYVLKNRLHCDLLIAVQETLAGRIFNSLDGNSHYSS